MSWLSGGSSKEDSSSSSGLSQPLTRNEYPGSSTGGPSLGGGYAPPPAPTGYKPSMGDDAPPLPAYQPPSISPTSGKVEAAMSNPPVFMNNIPPQPVGGSGGWIPQPPPLPPPPSSGDGADPAKVKALMEMGFDGEKVRKALVDHANNEENALNQLISE